MVSHRWLRAGPHARSKFTLDASAKYPTLAVHATAPMPDHELLKHAAHVVVPVSKNVPALHDTHWLMPKPVLYDPPMHVEHAVAPETDDISPGGHLAQTALAVPLE